MRERTTKFVTDGKGVKIMRSYHAVPRITGRRHEACGVMTNGDREGRIFLLSQIMDSFSCSPLNTSFYIGKTWKRLPENPEYAEMRHGDIILTLGLQWRNHSASLVMPMDFLSHPHTHDGFLYSAALHLGLHSLQMSIAENARCK